MKVVFILRFGSILILHLIIAKLDVQSSVTTLDHSHVGCEKSSLGLRCEVVSDKNRYYTFMAKSAVKSNVTTLDHSQKCYEVESNKLMLRLIIATRLYETPDLAAH